MILYMQLVKSESIHFFCNVVVHLLSVTFDWNLIYAVISAVAVQKPSMLNWQKPFIHIHLFCDFSYYIQRICKFMA